MSPPFPTADYLQRMRERIDGYLKRRLEAMADRVPQRLFEAIGYSLMAGGKRLRPILCLAFAEAVGPKSGGKVLEDAACALEMVHTYSLIHDDLPPMDDDDLRRGKPTNHKVFGEAVAILAGDGLLTEAFGLLSRGDEPVRLKLCQELSQAAGSTGMVAGQTLDIAPDRPSEEGYLLRLHRLKTGALLRASCRMGVLCAKGDEEALRAAGAYGDGVGLAFQIVDDVLDVTSSADELGKRTGRDEAEGRFTFPRLLGLPKSRAMAEERIDQAVRAIAQIEPRPGPLTALARYAVERRE